MSQTEINKNKLHSFVKTVFDSQLELYKSNCEEVHKDQSFKSAKKFIDVLNQSQSELEVAFIFDHIPNHPLYDDSVFDAIEGNDIAHIFKHFDLTLDMHSPVILTTIFEDSQKHCMGDDEPPCVEGIVALAHAKDGEININLVLIENMSFSDSSSFIVNVNETIKVKKVFDEVKAYIVDDNNIETLLNPTYIEAFSTTMLALYLALTKSGHKEAFLSKKIDFKGSLTA